MKTINTYINEKLRLTNKYSCQPEDKDELQRIIFDRIKNDGDECDLNDIDVSKIKDMSCLFDAWHNKIFKNFNGNISGWNVSNVENMHSMFYDCRNFNCDISKWNVSNVKSMSYMFRSCEKFNQDLDSWDVSNVEDMTSMFRECKQFKYSISNWNVSNVKDMSYMFVDCDEFNCDLSTWNVSNVRTIECILYGCKNFNQDLNKWNVSKNVWMKYAFRHCPTQPIWYDRNRWESDYCY